MSFRYKKPLQTITLFLVICLANGYVFAFTPDKNTAATIKPETLSAGILNAFDASTVRVNGNAAQDGMTILSGAEIKTSKNSGATINLRRLGKVEVNSDTSVKLFFTTGQVDLQVLTGQASLTTYKGINGSLTGTDGKLSKNNSSLEISSVGNIENVIVDDVLPAPAADSTGLFGMSFWTTAAVVGGVVGGSVLALLAAAQTENNSQSPVSRVRP